MNRSPRRPKWHYATMVDGLMWRGMRFTQSLEVQRPHLAASLRRCVTLLWWIATFQLCANVRLHLGARQNRKPGNTPATPPADPP
jgi:hypothetical protein